METVLVVSLETQNSLKYVGKFAYQQVAQFCKICISISCTILQNLHINKLHNFAKFAYQQVA